MRYHRPLRRYVRRPAGELAPGAGSVVTTEYVDPLLENPGRGLRFPSDFVDQGDMSRGGLLHRSLRNRRELTYVPTRGTVLRGSRLARLAPMR